MHALGATECRNACIGTAKYEKACMGHNEVLECMHRAQQSVNIFMKECTHGKMLERKCVILEWGHVGKDACGRILINIGLWTEGVCIQRPEVGQQAQKDHQRTFRQRRSVDESSYAMLYEKRAFMF
jgi:hypothetical protein